MGKNNLYFVKINKKGGYVIWRADLLKGKVGLNKKICLYRMGEIGNDERWEIMCSVMKRKV